MAATKKIPAIRFKGFEEEWEQFFLEDVVEFYTGLTYSPKNVRNSGTFVLRSSNVKKGEIVDADNVYVDPDVVNSINVRVGDIIVVVRNGSRSLIGKHAQIKREMNKTVIGAFMTGIHYEYSSFLNALLDSPKFYKEIEKNLGATINQITTGAFKKMHFAFPDPTEQTLIGKYFKGLDNLIQLQEQKLEKVTNLKKAMLAKMFPKENADVPEIRFKGFTEKWEKKKLEEVGSVVMSKRIFKYQTKDTGEIPFYKIGTFGGKANAFISRAIFEDYKAKYPYPNKGDILISASGSIGKTVEYLGIDEYFQDSNIVWLKHDDSVLNLFLKYFYSIVKWSGLEGSTIKRLYNSNILTTYISLPSIQEQQKIGAYFQNLDQLINQSQKEIEQLKHLKQALLQKMFI